MVKRLALAALVLCSCARRHLVLPAEMRPADAAAPATSGAATSTSPAKRQVLRMTEAGRVWEMELPDDGSDWEVRVPMRPASTALTSADRELMGPAAPDKGTSLLEGLARVNDLYAARKYELALVEAVELEKQYPKEARLAAMKGSLYLKLGKSKLARESWTRALELDPDDRDTAEALRALGEE